VTRARLMIKIATIHLQDEVNLGTHLVAFENDPFKSLLHRCENYKLGQVVGTGPWPCSNCGELITIEANIACAEIMGCIIPKAPVSEYEITYEHPTIIHVEPIDLAQKSYPISSYQALDRVQVSGQVTEEFLDQQGRDLVSGGSNSLICKAADRVTGWYVYNTGKLIEYSPAAGPEDP